MSLVHFFLDLAADEVGQRDRLMRDARSVVARLFPDYARLLAQWAHAANRRAVAYRLIARRLEGHHG